MLQLNQVQVKRTKRPVIGARFARLAGWRRWIPLTLFDGETWQYCVELVNRKETSENRCFERVEVTRTESSIHGRHPERPRHAGRSAFRGKCQKMYHLE